MRIRIRRGKSNHWILPRGNTEILLRRYMKKTMRRAGRRNTRAYIEESLTSE